MIIEKTQTSYEFPITNRKKMPYTHNIKTTSFITECVRRFNNSFPFVTYIPLPKFMNGGKFAIANGKSFT